MSRFAIPRSVRRFSMLVLVAAAAGLFLSQSARAATVIEVSGDASYGSSTTIEAGEVLRFDPAKDTTLEVSGNLVIKGTLEMKPNPGVTHTLRFLGVDEDAFVGGGTVVLESDRGLWVVDAGKLDIQGEEKVGWNRTGTDPSWKSTDELKVAPHKKGDYGLGGFDSFTLGSSVPSADPSVPATEVINLTRSVNIEGTASGRSHVTIMSSVPQEIRYATFRYMGPRQMGDSGLEEGVMGRYPIHFHHNEDGSRGSIVEGNVVRESGHRAIVPHFSHGVTVRDNVVYDVFDDAMWWDLGEDNETHDTVFDGNFVGYVQVADSSQGYTLTGFHLGRGDGNVANNNAVAGVLGSLNCSGYKWPSQGSGLWEFQGNVAHNLRCDGIFVWQNSSPNHHIESFVSYRNGEAGVHHGAYTNDYVYTDLYLFENEDAGIITQAWSHPPRTGQLQQTWTCVTVVGSPVGMRVVPSGANTPGDAAIFDHLVFKDVGVDFEVPEEGIAVGQDLDARVVLTNFGVECADGCCDPFAGGATSENRFVDDDQSPHESNIEKLAELGITVGCNPPVNDKFCPSDSVTRAQMATFLSRALKLPPATKDYFRDDNGSTHEPGINALAEAGISSGCNGTDTNYCPGEPITRAQMASFLVRALDLPASGTNYFVDDNSSSHEPNINALAAVGITSGCQPANKLFCPSDSVTRAQMATFLIKALNAD